MSKAWSELTADDVRDALSALGLDLDRVTEVRVTAGGPQRLDGSGSTMELEVVEVYRGSGDTMTRKRVLR